MLEIDSRTKTFISSFQVFSSSSTILTLSNSWNQIEVKTNYHAIILLSLQAIARIVSI